jgi:hypothetical protein
MSPVEQFPPSDPDNLRRVTQQEAALMELRVLGHDDVAVLSRVVPHDIVLGPRQADVAHVYRSREDVGQR